MNVSIDILIPVYNHAEHLTRCLESAVNQTLPANRIICVDDASPDPRVRQLLSDFSLRHSNVSVVFLPENRGICAAQNEGLRSSTADYVAFLDCDDWLHDDAVEKVVASIAIERPGYLFTDRIDVNDATGAQTVRVYGGQPHLREKRSHMENLIDHMVASHMKVIKRDLIEGIGGFAAGTDGVQDWDVALKLSEVAPFYHLNEPLYFHRVHSGQNSSYDSVINIRKTNQVRHNAQLRRYGGSARRNSGCQLRLGGVLKKIHAGSPDFVKTIAVSQIFLAVDANGEVFFSPQDRRCLKELMTSKSLTEVLLFGRGELYLELLKDLWKIADRPAIGFFLEELDDMSQVINPIRWSNSYFDYVICEGPQAQISLLGFTHPALDILIL